MAPNPLKFIPPSPCVIVGDLRACGSVCCCGGRGVGELFTGPGGLLPGDGLCPRDGLLADGLFPEGGLLPGDELLPEGGLLPGGVLLPAVGLLPGNGIPGTGVRTLVEEITLGATAA